jgi:hypothetical protein
MASKAFNSFHSDSPNLQTLARSTSQRRPPRNGADSEGVNVDAGRVFRSETQVQGSSSEVIGSASQLQGSSSGSFIGSGAVRVRGAKEVGNVVVYGVESFVCRACRGEMSCKACHAKVNEARSEFRWVYITRLLCIRGQCRPKDPRGLGYVFEGLNRTLQRRAVGGFKGGPEVALENSRRAALGGSWMSRSGRSWNVDGDDEEEDL